MLPVAKSTELLFVNQTLFDKFGSAAGVSTESLSTFEGLFAACEKYYDWSDGQDMFQINDFYHYSLTGMAAFGEDFVVNGKLNLESEAFDKVWEPMAHAGIYGGLCLGDGYASDRWKTGEVIINIGSTAGILYLRDYVTYSDNTTEDIETSILAYPQFANGNATVVHRGGGLFALKNEDERKNEAAAVFAKWLTEKENNLGFVTNAGYLPVTNDAFDYLFDNIETVENEKYRLLYNAHGVYEASVFEGLFPVLQTLRKAGYQLAVATSKPQTPAELVTNHFKLTPCFDKVCGSSEDEKGSKLRVIQNALSAFHAAPARTLMIGDTHFDAEGAQLAGTDFLGVLYGYGTEEEMRRFGGRHFVKTPEEIQHWLLQD